MQRHNNSLNLGPSAKPVSGSGASHSQRPTSGQNPPPFRQAKSQALNPVLPLVIGFALLVVLVLLLLLFMSQSPKNNAGLGDSHPTASATETDASLSESPLRESGVKIDNDEASSAAATDGGDQDSDRSTTAKSSNSGVGDSEPPPEPADLNSLSAEEMAKFAPSTNAGGKGIAPIGGKAKFFGLESQGNHIAYVIDKSGSMSGHRLELTKKKLIESLQGLSTNQKFSIYFFDNSPEYDRKFTNCRATDANRKPALNWLKGIYASGGTDPLPALNLALSGDCDVIFLLSDGEFEPGAADRIKRANGKRRSISTISMGFDSATLKDIAKQNNGKYIMTQ